MVKPAIVVGAEVGIRLDTLDEKKKTQLEWRLTVNSRPWKSNPSVTVLGYREEDGYLWVPRQFAFQQGFVPESDLQTTGTPQDFDLFVTLDPSRGQVDAVPAMVKHIRENGAGMLVAPTGNGKTLMSYAIGREFKTSIGVFVYAGHMVDNWVEQAVKVFGVKPEDVGMVQQDRCDLGKPITIMSIQSLLSRRYPDELYSQIGFLIADEVPRYGAVEWSQVLRQFPAKWRLGVAAEIHRNDGLERVVEWNLGKIGHTIEEKTVILTIVGVHTDSMYPPNSYKDFKLSAERGEFVADSMRYDKKLVKDSKRNDLIIEKLLEARKQGRKILVFSRLRDHLDDLRARCDLALQKAYETDPTFPKTVVDFLVGGRKKKDRYQAYLADIKFATYKFCSDAMNDTSNDTLFFCTPPGNPLQPAGRLRDKGPRDRKPLLICEFTEDTPFSEERWEQHVRTYQSLGFTVKRVKGKFK